MLIAFWVRKPKCQSALIHLKLRQDQQKWIQAAFPWKGISKSPVNFSAQTVRSDYLRKLISQVSHGVVEFFSTLLFDDSTVAIKRVRLFPLLVMKFAFPKALEFPPKYSTGSIAHFSSMAAYSFSYEVWLGP